ncbi:DUF2946 family protein [Ruegeria marina]|uniref:DUF2946 domain-containing protein n=1 Tax=Ruegeria marina TaxID=639004 RepID=A0A1G6UG47_9RHOB|nr:DUF2946 family protein [Ruegeria marina]SDD40342.1 Protein of unknown function [Ruegeria marina]
MSCRRKIENLPHRALRALAGCAAILLLLLQMVAPQLAQAGQGNWIEICSDGGAVWVQVTEGETPDPNAPCPRCADCALCALTAEAPVPDLSGWVPFVALQNGQSPLRRQYKTVNSPRLRPETRGPPCAYPASIQNIGEAPCS